MDKLSIKVFISMDKLLGSDLSIYLSSEYSSSNLTTSLFLVLQANIYPVNPIFVWIIQEQLNNIFVCIMASSHKCGCSIISSCIQFNSFVWKIQEQLHNIFVSIIASSHKCSSSILLYGIQFNA